MDEPNEKRRARLYERPTYRNIIGRIAGNCRRLRRARQWTQVQTAVRAEMATYLYQRVESGRSNITSTVLARLVDAFEVDPAEMLAPVDPPPPNLKRGRPFDRDRGAI